MPLRFEVFTLMPFNKALCCVGLRCSHWKTMCASDHRQQTSSHPESQKCE